MGKNGGDKKRTTADEPGGSASFDYPNVEKQISSQRDLWLLRNECAAELLILGQRLVRVTNFRENASSSLVTRLSAIFRMNGSDEHATMLRLQSETMRLFPFRVRPQKWIHLAVGDGLLIPNVTRQ